MCDINDQFNKMISAPDMAPVVTAMAKAIPLQSLVALADEREALLADVTITEGARAHALSSLDVLIDHVLDELDEIAVQDALDEARLIAMTEVNIVRTNSLCWHAANLDEEDLAIFLGKSLQEQLEDVFPDSLTMKEDTMTTMTTAALPKMCADPYFRRAFFVGQLTVRTAADDAYLVSLSNMESNIEQMVNGDLGLDEFIRVQGVETDAQHGLLESGEMTPMIHVSRFDVASQAL